MKKLALSILVAFAFSMAAVAQTATDPSQGSSPSMSQPSQQQPGMPTQQQPQPDSSASQSTPTSGDTPSTEKSGKEKQLRGCVQSQGGQYVLESKKGKSVALTGQDVAAHVGHEVSLKGTWESGSTGTGVSTASGSASEKTFNVTSVEMISETCGGKSSTTPNSSSPEGSGSTSNPPQQ